MLKMTSTTGANWVRAGLVACLGFGLTAQADVPHDFTSGTPVRASEMNANFQDLDQRLTGLEGGPGGGQELTIVDCGPDAAALQGAIEEAHPGDTIEFSGACDPIDVRVDELTIRGTTGAMVTTAAPADAVVIVDSARQVVLENFTVDANDGMAEEGVVVDVGAIVGLVDLVVVDAEDGNISVRNGSLVKLGGGNTVGELDDDTGLNVGGNATVLIEGENTINASFGAIDCEFAGVVLQEGEGPDEMLTVNGRTGAIENCFIFISNGTLNGDIQMQQNSSMTLEPEDSTSSIVATGNIQLSQYSSLLVDNEGPVTLGGGTMTLINGTVIMHGGTLNSNLELHAASRAELGNGVVTQSGTDTVQLHSFSTLQSNQSTGGLTTNEVVCFGSNSAFSDDGVGGFVDLCQ